MKSRRVAVTNVTATNWVTELYSRACLLASCVWSSSRGCVWSEPVTPGVERQVGLLLWVCEGGGAEAEGREDY